MAKQSDEPQRPGEVPPDDGGGPTEPEGDELRLGRIAKQLSRAYGVALLIIPQRDAVDGDYLRIVPIGHARAAYSLLEASVTEGEVVGVGEERLCSDDDDD